MLLATTCPACGRAGAAPCARCVARMARSQPIPPLAELDGCVALLSFEGPAREVVARVKYRNQRDVVRWLGRAMADLVDPAAIDVVTWAPTTAARRRQRGFDHAELLARRVGREQGRPVRSLLLRGPGPPQTGRGAAARRLGPHLAAKRPVPGARVLVVDDVVTTGATLAAAARALRAAGADVVLGLAAAHPR